MGVQSVKPCGINLFLLTIFSGFIFFCSTGMASSFPFRAIHPGDPVPPLTFMNVHDNSTISLGDLKGYPVALVFWGMDMETKKERSLKTFAALAEILPFLRERKFKILLINAQGDPENTIGEVSSLTSGLPVYVDKTQKAYGDLGIFVVPSVLLIDREGNAVSGLGYSHDFSDRLKGEVEIMGGEKTREEMEEELRPAMKEKSAEEKETVRHFNMAEVMIKRGQIDSAISELQKALEIDSGFGDAYGRLGCLYLEKGELEKARVSLDRSYEVNPDFLPANICDALARADEGLLDEAIGDLQALLFRHARDPELHYSLGTLLEKQEKFGEAAGEYRRAYELIAKKVEFE